MNTCAGAVDRFGCRPAIIHAKAEKCQQEPRLSASARIERLKVRRDSQSSLPKTEASTYLDDNAKEL